MAARCGLQGQPDHYRPTVRGPVATRASGELVDVADGWVPAACRQLALPYGPGAVLRDAAVTIATARNRPHGNAYPAWRYCVAKRLQPELFGHLPHGVTVGRPLDTEVGDELGVGHGHRDPTRPTRLTWRAVGWPRPPLAPARRAVAPMPTSASFALGQVRCRICPAVAIQHGYPVSSSSAKPQSRMQIHHLPDVSDLGLPLACLTSLSRSLVTATCRTIKTVTPRQGLHDQLGGMKI